MHVVALFTLCGLSFLHQTAFVVASITFEGWPSIGCDDSEIINDACSSRVSGKYCYPCSSEKYTLCTASGGSIESCPAGQKYDYHSRYCVDEDNKGLVTCPDLPCPLSFSSTLPGVTLLSPELVRSETDGRVSLSVVDVSLEERGDIWIADALPGRCMLGRTFQVHVSCPSPLPRTPKTWVVDLGDVSAIGTSVSRLVPISLPSIDALCGDVLRVLSEGGMDDDYMLALYHPVQLGDTPRHPGYQQDWLCPTEDALSSSTGVLVMSPPLHANTVDIKITPDMTDFWLMDPQPGHCAAGMVAKVSVSCPASAPLAPSIIDVSWGMTEGPMPPVTARCGDTLSVTWPSADEVAGPVQPRHGLVIVTDTDLIKPAYAVSPVPVATVFRGWPHPKCDDSTLPQAICSKRPPGLYCYNCDAAKYIECPAQGVPSVRDCPPGYLYDYDARFCVANDTQGYVPCPAWPMPALYGPSTTGIGKANPMWGPDRTHGASNVTVPADLDSSMWVADAGPGHQQIGMLFEVHVTCPAVRPAPSIVDAYLARITEDFGPVGYHNQEVNAVCGDTVVAHIPLGHYVAKTEILPIYPELYNGPFLLGTPQSTYTCPMAASDLDKTGTKVLGARGYAGNVSYKVPNNLPVFYILDSTSNHCINGQFFKVTVVCPAARGSSPKRYDIEWKMISDVYPDMIVNCGDTLHFFWDGGDEEISPFSAHSVMHDVTIALPSTVTRAYVTAPAQLTVRNWEDTKCDDAVLINQTCAVRPPGRYCYPCSTAKYISCKASGEGAVKECAEGSLYDMLWQGCTPLASVVATCEAFPCPTLVGDVTSSWVTVLPTTPQYTLQGLSSSVTYFKIPDVNMVTEDGERPPPPRSVYLADAQPGKCSLGAGVELLVTCSSKDAASAGTGVMHHVHFDQLPMSDTSLLLKRLAPINASCGDTVMVHGSATMVPVWYMPGKWFKDYWANNIPFNVINTPLLPYPPQPVHSCPSLAGGVQVLSAPQKVGSFVLDITPALGAQFWVLDPTPGNCRNGMIFKVTTQCPAPFGTSPMNFPVHWVMTGNVFPDMELACGDSVTFTWGGGELNTQTKGAARVAHGVAIADDSAGVTQLRGAAASVRDAVEGLPLKLQPLYHLVNAL